MGPFGRLFFPPQELSLLERRQWSRCHAGRVSFGFALAMTFPCFLILLVRGGDSLLASAVGSGAIGGGAFVAMWIGLRLDVESTLERRQAGRGRRRGAGQGRGG